MICSRFVQLFLSRFLNNLICLIFVKKESYDIPGDLPENFPDNPPFCFLYRIAISLLMVMIETFSKREVICYRYAARFSGALLQL